ncbi:MAG: protein-disulfide reductase DsbD domain-containing protein [Acidobacteriota bacterium]
MTSIGFLAALALLAPAWAQTSGVVAAVTPPRTTGKRGGVMDARVTVQLRNGYHVNSNTPADDYLIPLRLTWAAAPLEVAATTFPKPKLEKYSFSAKPVSVFTGDFDILTRLKVPESVMQGPGVLLGKLRYQACNDNSCLPPKTIEVRLAYQIQ